MTNGNNVNNENIIYKALTHFAYTARNKNNDNRIKAERIEKIMQEKEALFTPLISMLHILQKDINIEVENSRKYSLQYNSNSDNDYTRLNFKKKLANENDDRCYPSPIYIIEHPIRLEFSIYNEDYRKNYGLIRVNIGDTSHPDKNMFTKTFNSMEELCMQIADFLGKNTVNINSKKTWVDDELEKN